MPSIKNHNVDKPMETYEIKGVEIFSEGTWNGDAYTNEDLMQMVFAFENTKHGIPPYLKLGHDDNQKLLQKDGMPAAGWIDKLYVVGHKLVADFSHVPKKIFELIKSKAYRKVSCEIYWNAKVDGKTYQKLLGAVALLGANTPGVMNLQDIMGCYFKNTDFEKLATYQGEAIEIKTYHLKKEKSKMEKTEEQIRLEYEMKEKSEKLSLFEKENETLKAQQAEAAEKMKNLEIQAEEFKTFKAEQEKKAAADALAAKKLETENFVLSLEKDNLVTPAMKPYVQSLVSAIGEKKEYSVSLKDGEKKVGPQDLIKELLRLSSKSKVNFTETSVEGDKLKAPVDELDPELDKAINDYAEKHNLSYGQAAKIVFKQQKG